MPEFFNATDAAPLLGITERTVRERIKSGAIPAEKIPNARNVPEWQIAADWVYRNTPEASQQCANDTGNSAPEVSQQGADTTGTAAPEHTGTDTGSPDIESESPHRNHDSPTVIAPEQTAIVMAERAGILATIVTRAMEPLALEMAAMNESNRALSARLEAIQDAQIEAEASRARDALQAREEAAAREERIIEVAREHVKIKAQNERLQNEIAALQNRKWWQFGK